MKDKESLVLNFGLGIDQNLAMRGRDCEKCSDTPKNDADAMAQAQLQNYQAIIEKSAQNTNFNGLAIGNNNGGTCTSGLLGVVDGGNNLCVKSK